MATLLERMNLADTEDLESPAAFPLPSKSLLHKMEEYAGERAFRYSVSPLTESRQQRIERFRRESEAAKNEERRTSGTFNIFKAAAKEFGKQLVPSEIAAVETIRKTAGSQRGSYLQSISGLADSQVKLIRKIRSDRSAGRDTSRLERQYNQNADQLDELHTTLGEEAKLPTNVGAVAQIAGVGLDVLSGGTYGLAAAGTRAFRLAPKAAMLPTAIQAMRKLAQEPAGLLTRQGLKRAGAGGGVGYTYDVVQGLQSQRGPEREGARALIPGLGTAIGTGVPSLTGAAQSVRGLRSLQARERAVNELEQSYINWFGGTTAGKKKVDMIVQKTGSLDRAGTTGRTPMRTLAEDGVIPNRSGTKFDTFEQSKQYQETTRPMRSANRAALEESGLGTQPVNINDLERDAVTFARSQENIDAGIADDLERDIRLQFEGMRKNNPDGTLSLLRVDDIKSARWGNVFKNKGLVEADRLKKNSDYAIAKAMQKRIERVADGAGHSDVAQLNREIGDRLEAARFLEDLNGKTIKGGRLLKYVTTVIGSSFGHSIPGKIIGALGGNIVGELIISSNVSTPTRRLLLRHLQKENPAAYERTVQWLQKQRLDRETRLLLTPGESKAIPLGPGADTSSVRGERASIIPPKLLGSGATRLGPGKDTSGIVPLVQSQSPTAQQTTPAITNTSKSSIPNNLLQQSGSGKLLPKAEAPAVGAGKPPIKK